MVFLSVTRPLARCDQGLIFGFLAKELKVNPLPTNAGDNSDFTQLIKVVLNPSTTKQSDFTHMFDLIFDYHKNETSVRKGEKFG